MYHLPHEHGLCTQPVTVSKPLRPGGMFGISCGGTGSGTGGGIDMYIYLSLSI